MHLDGTVDMDNTTTRGYGQYEVAFQPNISLKIENIGTSPVVDPWIVVNDMRDFRTIDSIITEATRGALDEQDKLMLLYEFARSHRYHDNPLFQGDELHDPVKHFNCYGAGLCDDIGRVTCALAYRAGFTKERHGGDPVIRSMHGHVMSEIAVNGHYQFIDTDENAFYLDPGNEHPVSGDDIVRDSDLAARDYTYGPLFKSWGTGEKAAALLGRDDGKGRSITIGHEMHITLRPGEKLTLRWDNIGKIPGPKTLKYFANSFLDYKPKLNGACIECAHESHGITSDNGALISTNSNANITFAVKSPYVICGETVRIRLECGNNSDSAAVAVSIDGEHWKEVWTRTGKGSFTCEATLDDSLGVKGDVAIYGYFVRISLASHTGSARLTSLKLHTDLLTSPIALPRLSLGKNLIRYTDATRGQRRVKVTHTYQESDNITPPAIPVLLSPADNTVSRDAWIEFKWREVSGADKYHLRVSRRADLETSYRPCFDVVIDGIKHCNRRTGLFNESETYYWSIRARNENGVWGNRSPVESFSWSGPRPPVDVKEEYRNGKIYLTWKANSRGNHPVRYEVYASDIRGFTPRREPHTVHTLGEMPSNLIAETTGTEYLIVSHDPADNAPNKSSYRVAAIDENGTPGGSSRPVELEHPLIYSIPVLEAKAGELYEYRVLTLRSLGDLQYRYQKPGYSFWEREGYEFLLTESPVWLTMNPETGVISGTPGNYNTEESRITMIVNRTWPHEVKSNQYRPEHFMKDIPEYEASDTQSFILKVLR